jgi:uncharacterized protein YheU (UPF0270 family)
MFVECCLPYPALPLTFDNVFEAVKTVRLSWRDLAYWLVGWHDYKGSEDREKLDAIEHQHVSDEARLKAVVEAFLLGEGEYQPSWRMLIHALHWAHESHLAETIKTNAESQQGEWVLVWREMIRLTHNICTLHGSDCCVLTRAYTCACD